MSFQKISGQNWVFCQPSFCGSPQCTDSPSRQQLHQRTLARKSPSFLMGPRKVSLWDPIGGHGGRASEHQSPCEVSASRTHVDLAFDYRLLRGVVRNCIYQTARQAKHRITARIHARAHGAISVHAVKQLRGIVGWCGWVATTSHRCHKARAARVTRRAAGSKTAARLQRRYLTRAYSCAAC
jgi:hypothetical protein